MADIQVLYNETVAGTTAATTAWVDLATIAAGSFTGGRTYLILANQVSIHDNSTNYTRARLVYGTTPTAFTDATLQYEGTLTTQEHEVSWMYTYAQPATPDLVKIQISSNTTGSTITNRLSQIIAIDITDWTSGTDYIWTQDTVDYTYTTTPTAKATSASFTPNGTDVWLYASNLIHGVNTTLTTQISFELYDSVAGVLNRTSQEGEDTADQLGANQYWVGVPTNAARTIAVRPAQATTADATMFSARTLALNLTKLFTQVSYVFAAGEIDPATTPTYTNVATVSPTPAVTGDWVYLAFSNQDVNEITTDWEARLQVNPDGGGLVSDPAFASTAPSIDQWDITDETAFSIFKLHQLDSGAARAINWDWRQVAGTTGRVEDNGLVAFSVVSHSFDKVFAQAQTHIKHTDNQVWAQAEVGIKTTEREFGQAQVEIAPPVTTYSVYAQGQAAIVRTEQDYAQAQSWIKHTELIYGQTQTTIKQAYQAWAQGNTHIKRTEQVYAQGNAWIKVTGITSYAQSQAHINATYLSYGQAMTATLQISMVTAQVQTWIEIYPLAYAQASVWIKQTYPFGGGATVVAQDSFTESGTGLVNLNTHTAEIGGTWSIHHDEYSVNIDRSTDTVKTINQDNAYYYLPSTNFSDGDIYLTIKAGSERSGVILRILGSNPAIYYAAVARNHDDFGTPRQKISLWYSNTSASHMDVGTGNIDKSGIWTLDTEIRLRVNVQGSSPTYIKVKAWETSGLEPDTWDIDTSDNRAENQSAVPTPVGIIFRTLGNDGEVDDFLAISGTAVQGPTFAQAQATIKTSSSQYAQAQVYIESLLKAGYAQALGQVGRIDNLYSYIDEVVADDNDYIVSPLVVAGSSMARVQLSSLIAPDWPIDHILRFRAARTAGSDNGAFTIHLYQDTTLIFEYNPDISTSFQTYIYELTSLQIAAITDYSALAIEFEAQNGKALVSWVEFQVPSGSGSKKVRQYAQAQAFIFVPIQTVRQYGQAQAQIRRTEQGYAQAQGKIILSGQQIFAQAQSQIKQTYQAYAQANTKIILSALKVYGQALAAIKTTYNAYAQANAYIKIVGINSYAQSQAQIKQTYLVYGQTQAKINAFGTQQYAQASVWIEGSFVPSGQAQAKINAFGTRQYGQAAAIIKTTYLVHAQSITRILNSYQAVSQAQVQIRQTYQVYAQAQARFIAFGVRVYGQASVWIAGSFVVFAQAQTRIYAFKVNAYAQGQAQIKQTYRVYATAQSQVKQSYLSVAQVQATIEQSYVVAAQAQANIKTTYLVWAQGNAYIILSGLQVYAQASAYIISGIKVYAQAQTQIKAVSNQYAQAATWIAGSSVVFAQAQAKINAFGIQTYGQAAVIVKTTQVVHAQAITRILTSYQAVAQAKTGIKSISAVSAQAQTIIRTTNQVYGLAMTATLQTSTVTAHATTSIKQVYIVSAQAQVKLNVYAIKQYAQATVWMAGSALQLAQAQTRILAYNVQSYAQVWAQIKITSTQIGQAQALIKVSTRVYGQAQAQVKQVYLPVAQAQTSIKTTYQVYAQSLAQILHSYLVSAQSIAQIYIVGQGFANALVLIKQTYNSYAQSQAQILGLYVNQQYATAQGWIKTTVSVYAQAEANIILSGLQQFAQAEVLITTAGNQVYAQATTIILATYSSQAQAEALILKSAGYGQAQVFTIFLHTLKTLIISDHSLGLVLSDRDSIEEIIDDTLIEPDITDDIIEFNLRVSDRGLLLVLSDRNY